MSDISTLIREAKPLYFKRKKRRQCFKIISGLSGCFIIALLLTVMTSPVNQTSSDMNEFYTYLYDDTSYQVLIGANEITDTDDWFTTEYILTQVI